MKLLCRLGGGQGDALPFLGLADQQPQPGMEALAGMSQLVQGFQQLAQFLIGVRSRHQLDAALQVVAGFVRLPAALRQAAQRQQEMRKVTLRSLGSTIVS